MTASTGHARKRQFQPSIDSFFHRDAASNVSADRQVVDSPFSPPLPGETQASLLSVGMRVRKSVPEGYKTHKTIGVHISPITSSAPPRTTIKPKQRNGGSNSRELMPFCGLHKTGGLASQHVPSSAPAAIFVEDEVDDMDDMPDLSISQSTLEDTMDGFSSTPSGWNKKRSYEEEMEEGLDAYFNNDAAMDSPAFDQKRHSRPMAKMKLTLRGGTNRMVGGMDGCDFDEAGFLVPEVMEVDEG